MYAVFNCSNVIIMLQQRACLTVLHNGNQSENYNVKSLVTLAVSLTSCLCTVHLSCDWRILCHTFVCQITHNYVCQGCVTHHRQRYVLTKDTS